MSEDRSVQGAVYALIESMLDLGKTPAEVKYGLGRIMSELKIAPVALSPTDGAPVDPSKGQAPQ